MGLGGIGSSVCCPKEDLAQFAGNYLMVWLCRAGGGGRRGLCPWDSKAFPKYPICMYQQALLQQRPNEVQPCILRRSQSATLEHDLGNLLDASGMTLKHLGVRGIP